jgi:hypothetical protein
MSFPSCSEAGAAAVVETMAAGVIPVVTYEASIDVENFGFLLEDASIETIMRQVREIAAMSADDLRRRAKKRGRRPTTITRRRNFRVPIVQP